MIKVIKKGDTVQITGIHKLEHLIDTTGEIKVTKETPTLDHKTMPHAHKELSCERVGEHFMVSVNGIYTILDKDQATFIGSRLMTRVTELAQETPPEDDFMIGK